MRQLKLEGEVYRIGMPIGKTKFRISYEELEKTLKKDEELPLYEDFDDISSVSSDKDKAIGHAKLSLFGTLSVWGELTIYEPFVDKYLDIFGEKGEPTAVPKLGFWCKYDKRNERSGELIGARIGAVCLNKDCLGGMISKFEVVDIPDGITAEEEADEREPEETV